MAEHLSLAKDPIPSIVSRGEPLSLADWITLSWFYPEEFLLQKINNSPSRVEASGPHESYSFLLPLSSEQDQPQNELFSKYQAAVEEIEDHQHFAPGYYLGMRFLGWRDGDPIWLDTGPEIPGESHSPPQEASDVALVARAADKRATLQHLMELRGPSLEQALDRTVRRIIHSQKFCRLTLDEEVVAEEIDNHEHCLLQMLKELRESCRIHSVEQILVDEFFSDITRHGFELRKKQLQRASLGLFVDGHGDLRPEHILFELNGSALKRPAMIGRLPRGAFMRVADELSDLASLVFNLALTLDYSTLFEVIDSYRSRAKNTFCTKLFAHLLRAHAIKASHSALFDDTLESEQRWKKIRLYLSIAFRWKLSMDDPLVVVVHSNGESAFSKNLTSAIAEFVAAPIITLGDKVGGLQEIDKVLRRHRALAIQVHTASKIRRREIAHSLESQGVQPFYVRCEESGEMVLSGCQSDLSDKTSREIDFSLRLPVAHNESIVCPEVPEAILGREILRGIMSRNSLSW